MAHVEVLAEDIGPRVAGSAQEGAAADYIVAQLQSYGYQVELQAFPVATQSSRDSALAVLQPVADTLPSVPFERSSAGQVRGRLVAAGNGSQSDFTSDARGAIVLIQRGDLTFQEKVSNAAAAGAIAVVIYNNEAGIFYGTLQSDSSIPALSISQAAGLDLLANLKSGAVEVEVSIGVLGDASSHNVIAHLPGADCEIVAGGHYDTVAPAPGANDNASGTATTLEIARVLSRNGLANGICFVLFGAEETGLNGSKAYVASLSSSARDRIKAMLNFDMVGVGDEGWQLIGSEDLQAKAQELASGLGIQTVRSSLAGTGSSSDHASFLDAGIPALMFHRVNDSAWHTSSDALSRISSTHVHNAARMGVAMIKSLQAMP